MCPNCDQVAPLHELHELGVNEHGILRLIHTCSICNVSVTRDVDVFVVATTVAEQLTPTAKLSRAVN